MPRADPARRTTGTKAKPTYFQRPAQLRSWLAAHHASATELLVGFHKVASGKRSVTYAEALDEALCFGWIDGVRRSLNATSYVIRFTPRRPDSIWSLVNQRHVARLTAKGRMHPAGLKAFQERDPRKAERYSFENRLQSLDAASARRFKANRRAWAWFCGQAPGYRRTAQWWVMSAKQEETRARRLGMLIESSARGRKAPPFILPRSER